MTDLATRFRDHDEANPAIWRAFERRMLEVCRAARRRGCRRVGAKMVWERMRWDSFVGDFADLIETRDAAGHDAPAPVLYEHEDGQTSLFPPEPDWSRH